MTNIVWISDSHLNFVTNDKIKRLAHSLLDEDNVPPDHVIITGDVSDGNKLIANLFTLEEALQETNADVQLSVIIGNHDYYGSSVSGVRSQLRMADFAAINYLTSVGPVALTPNVCIIGTDGWCDAVYGDIYGNLVMNDWYEITDLRLAQQTGGIESVARKCADLARKEVENLRSQAARAIAGGYKHIIVATHIPPWKEATWHEGVTSNDDYLPWFSSYVMGHFLDMLAVDNQDIEFTVLCGHVHTAGIYRARDNMICYTGQADYGNPSVAGRLKVDDFGVTMVEFNNPYRNGV